MLVNICLSAMIGLSLIFLTVLLIEKRKLKKEKVNETHKDNEQYRKEYIGAIKYVKAIL